MPALPKERDEKLAQNLAKGSLTLKDAWIAAGFPYDKSRATNHSKQEHIQARVAELRLARQRVIDRTVHQELETSNAIATRLGITKEKLIQSLYFNAQRCLRGQPVLDANGVQIPGKYSGKPDANGFNQSVRLLGQECFNMFVEKMEIGGPGDFSRLSDDELFARLQADAEALGIASEALDGLVIEHQPSDESDKKDE